MDTQLFVLPFLHLGVGRLAADLMMAVRATGTRVVTVTSGWAGDLGDDPALVSECRAAGVTFERADVFTRDPHVMQETARILDECCARFEPALAHAFTAVAAAAVRRCPVIVSAVGWSPTKAAWQRTMDIQILGRCAEVTAVSEAVAAELADAGLTRKAIIIRNGVPIPRLSPHARKTTAAVGAVAHLIPRKGIDVLLEAVSLLPAGTFSHLRIAGAGESLRELTAVAHSLSLSCDVEWCGHVPIDAFLPTIDVLVVPSRSDALPLVLLDGMAAALPIVASRTGGIPEALAPGEGWLVEPGDRRGLADALAAVASDLPAARARGTLARDHARLCFSLERMAAQYLERYAAVRGGAWSANHRDV